MPRSRRSPELALLDNAAAYLVSVARGLRFPNIDLHNDRFCRAVVSNLGFTNIAEREDLLDFAWAYCDPRNIGAAKSLRLLLSKHDDIRKAFVDAIVTHATTDRSGTSLLRRALEVIRINAPGCVPNEAPALCEVVAEIAVAIGIDPPSTGQSHAIA